jgi:hypothetical protein
MFHTFVAECFHLDVAYACNSFQVFFMCFAGVSDIYCKCFICLKICCKCFLLNAVKVD